MDNKEWRALMIIHHPDAPPKDDKGKIMWYSCPGQVCPPTYQIPENWDVLGQLPPDLPSPSKKTKNDADTPSGFGSRPLSTISLAPKYEYNRPFDDLSKFSTPQVSPQKGP